MSSTALSLTHSLADSGAIHGLVHPGARVQVPRLDRRHDCARLRGSSRVTDPDLDQRSRSSGTSSRSNQNIDRRTGTHCNVSNGVDLIHGEVRVAVSDLSRDASSKAEDGVLGVAIVPPGGSGKQEAEGVVCHLGVAGNKRLRE